MLERHNRLRGKQLFQEIFTRGKKVFVPGITGFSLPLKDDTLVIGVTFKQKAFPKAITRHQYKRRTMALVRAHLAELPRGRAMVIHFSQPVLGRVTESLPKLLNQLLQSLTKI